MSRPPRSLFVAVALAVLAVYGAAAYVVFRLFALAWAARPPWPTTVGAVGLATLASGYLGYRFGTDRALAALDADPLSAAGAPRLHARVDDLSAAMDVERPSLYAARLEVPNAFALGGPDGGAVVLDRQLFRLLSTDEFTAILAHELAHLESRDGLVQTLAFTAVETVAGFLFLLALPLSLLVTGVAKALAWARGRPAAWERTPAGRLRRRVAQAVMVALFLLTLLALAHSRRREFAADDRAVEVTGDPLALARALRKISAASTPPLSPLAPLYVHGDEEGLLTRLLSTHPPMADRVERLLERVDHETAVPRGRRRSP